MNLSITKSPAFEVAETVKDSKLATFIASFSAGFIGFIYFKLTLKKPAKKMKKIITLPKIRNQKSTIFFVM